MIRRSKYTKYRFLADLFGVPLSADLDSSNLTVFDSVCLFHVSSDKNSYFEDFLVMVGASCQCVVSRLSQNLLSNLTKIGRLTHTLSSFQLGLKLMVC